jgi:2-polyprenyl-6-hydroxyphenyl methylase/3-demethylubiquinone-9 3-methyltransferase
MASVEELARQKKTYDVITALEVAEHVADMDSFFAGLKKLLKPNGLLIMSTLNRTPKSFLLGIVAAEYILQWVPPGTHQWKKFIRPSELVQRLEDNNLKTTHLTGLVFNPLQNAFELSQTDLAVNYMLTASFL